MNKFALTAALTAAMFAVSASPAHGSRLSRTRTLEGYALAYQTAICRLLRRAG